MKKYLLLAFLFSLSYLSVRAQMAWEELSPPSPGHPTSFAISGSNDYFFAGTYYDGIIRSTDKGATWQKVYYNVDEKAFYSVAVRPDGVVFVGGRRCLYFQ